MIDRSRDAENLESERFEGLVIPHPEKKTARKEKMEVFISCAGLAVLVFLHHADCERSIISGSRH